MRNLYPRYGAQPMHPFESILRATSPEPGRCAAACALHAVTPAPLLIAALTALVTAATACGSLEPTGLARTVAGPGAEVRFDSFHRPLPDIPLPNDLATRFDATSPTRRRINASVVAPTTWEKKTRESLDAINGWGTLAPITVSFAGPLDVENILTRHSDRFDPHNDVMLVIDITPGSADFCEAMPVDIGQGMFPVALDRADYYPSDPRGHLKQLIFEEVEEDVNGNGIFDPGEDTDMDGVFDHPNTRSATDPTLLTFYERETNTLIAKPVMPLREGTTYAVVLTRSLIDAEGHPVQSPFEFINHASQTEALAELPGCLGKLKLGVRDVAFTWTFTTQQWTQAFVTVRDGLYGMGPMAHLATDFPAEMDLADVRDAAADGNAKIVPGDVFMPMAKLLFSQFGPSSNKEELKIFFENFAFIDFNALGTIDSPQFFPRFVDDPGDGTEPAKQLPLTDQIWRLDPVSGEAYIRHEGVNFWLMVPKARNGPAPVAIFTHGHGSTKFDAMNFAGFLARQGIATIGIDAVSHGVDVAESEIEMVMALFDAYGIAGMGQGILDGRALDQNADGRLDSGVDFWTSYIFHTRDVVRQTAVDMMQVVRTLSSFDGKRRWKYDANHDGEPDLAGDFDGDGTVDVGGSAPIHLIGGSLGGIMSSFVAGLEPKIETSIAIIGGGVLGEIGTRSTLGGVRNAMILRMMGPLFLVHDGGLFEAFPDLTDYKEVKVVPMEALVPGRIAVIDNLTSGEHRCGRVQPDGALRVAVPSDKGDLLRISFYDVELKSVEREGCVALTVDGAPVVPTLVIDTFTDAVSYAGDDFAAGSPLIALTDGYGLRRANPELRRMLGIAQVALDGADPANSAPFIHQDRTLTYGTGETVSTRIFYVNTLGDPGVPTASGVALGRAAGLIDFRAVDARYDKSVQELLVDVGTVEGVEGTMLHTNAAGEGVLMDIEDLQSLVPASDGFDAPRLSPPLRLIRSNDAKVGGKSSILFPMMTPLGVHSFPVPSPDKPFDLGSLMINQVVRYMATHGEQLDFDLCQFDWSCSWIPPLLP